MDKDCIAKLVQLANSSDGLAKAQQIAAQALADAGEKPFPTNGCAATLSALLQLAGINVPMTLGAGKLVSRLGGPYGSRKWVPVRLGEQQAGDVGVTYDLKAPSGADHLYLVIERVDEDEMVIADNQAPAVHSRWASGRGGTTPTEYFLRAPENQPHLLVVNLASPLNEIVKIAENSVIANYHWSNRERAPMGYVKGMALTFARSYARLKNGDPFGVEMAKPETGHDSQDALAWYGSTFQGLGMDNSGGGADTLRHLFVLLMGLGMQESSGRYCEGRDRAADNVSADTAEAGLFQTSWNAHGASPLLSAMFDQYAGKTDYRDIFSEGVSCRPADLENFGTGIGCDFQALSKACPAFAVEFAAIGLRNIRKHWGPINGRTAEIRPACDEMLKQVQGIVDQNGTAQLTT